MSGSGCFLCAIRRVDQGVDRGAGQDKSTSKISNDRNMVCLSRIRCDDHKYSDDAAQHIRDGEPRVIRECLFEMLRGRNN